MATPLMRDLARALRQRPATGEQLLWQHLRNRQLGVKFRRQHPIGRAIADFACVEAGLVIEIDGDIHDEPANVAADANRDEMLRRMGFETLRFPSLRVVEDLAGVIVEVKAALTRRCAPPSPARAREGLVHSFPDRMPRAHRPSPAIEGEGGPNGPG